MKRSILFLVILLSLQFSYSQVSKTVNVTTAGTLSSLLTISEKNTVTNLTLEGNIDVRDFKTMRDNMPLLADVDLQNTNIQSYTGLDGTITSNIYTYPSNEIPIFSFNRKTTLTSLLLPLLTNSIGNSAFSGCTNITSITIPRFVSNIEDGAFLNCGGLINVVESNNNFSSLDGVLFNYFKTELIQCPIQKFGVYDIPTSVKIIKNYAFSNCVNLTFISIPSSVDSILYNAFYNCIGLNSLTIPSSVNFIEGAAFENCTELSSITIENSLPSNILLGNEPFYNVNKSTCVLYVPKGTKSLYQTAPVWKDFIFIEEMISTVLNNEETSDFIITYSNSNLLIKRTIKDELITIYNINGYLLKKIISKGDDITVPIKQNSLYLIKTKNKSIKVLCE